MCNIWDLLIAHSTACRTVFDLFTVLFIGICLEDLTFELFVYFVKVELNIQVTLAIIHKISFFLFHFLFVAISNRREIVLGFVVSVEYYKQRLKNQTSQ